MQDDAGNDKIVKMDHLVKILANLDDGDKKSACKKTPAGVQPAKQTPVQWAEETPACFMACICVQLKSNNQRAVIVKINADKSAMVEFEDKSTKAVQASELAH